MDDCYSIGVSTMAYHTDGITIQYRSGNNSSSYISNSFAPKTQ